MTTDQTHPSNDDGSRRIVVEFSDNGVEITVGKGIGPIELYGVAGSLTMQANSMTAQQMARQAQSGIVLPRQ